MPKNVIGIVLRSFPFCLALRCREMTETDKKVPAADIIDALLPPEMALACETAGVAKAERDGLALLILGLLAGAFIDTVTCDTSTDSILRVPSDMLSSPSGDVGD